MNSFHGCGHRRRAAGSTALARWSLVLSWLAFLVLSGCRPIQPAGVNATPLPSGAAASDDLAAACPVTDATWLKPPADSAVLSDPVYGYYFVNTDHSIWAAADWTGLEGSPLRAGKDGVKVGWFRPAGAELTISGQRIDGPSLPLEAHIPCCYPTRFQATGLIFPTPGCWQVDAQAAQSELSFTVWVAPE